MILEHSEISLQQCLEESLYHQRKKEERKNSFMIHKKIHYITSGEAKEVRVNIRY